MKPQIGDKIIITGTVNYRCRNDMTERKLVEHFPKRSLINRNKRWL